MAARGETSARAAQVATLETRRPKDRDVDTVHLRAGWRLKAANVGFDAVRLRELLGRHHREPPTADERHGIEQDLAGPAGLTERASTFDRPAVLRSWCNRLTNGAAVTDIEDMADRFLNGHAIVPLADPSTAPMHAVDGRVLSSVSTGRRWSTADLVALEARLLAGAVDRLDEACAVVDNNEDLAASLRAHPTLSNEQARVVAHLCGSGNGVDVVTAPAGAGKTFAIDAARDAWERAGYRVISAPLAARAAAELQAAAGVPSTTSTRSSVPSIAEPPPLTLAPSWFWTRPACAAPASWPASLTTPTQQAARSCSSAILASCPRSTPAACSQGWPNGSPACS